MHMPAPSIPNTEITLSFTSSELSQLEAFASLHGVTVSAFVKSAALDAAHVTPSKGRVKKSAQGTDALWMSEEFADAPEPNEKTNDLFATANPPETAAPVVKRGVTGEPSKFARGKGPVWDIRQALGRERLHGLGWTREQMAFVLNLSVVGVRKMEHLGTAPVKSVDPRSKLLDLAKLLENPGAEICAYIEREEKALG
jgi:uncharacterized protein (DUF1778 family)